MLLKRKYLRLTDIARVLGVHVGTLRRWERMGKVTFLRNSANNYRYLPVEDMAKLEDMLLKDNRKGPSNA